MVFIRSNRISHLMFLAGASVLTHTASAAEYRYKDATVILTDGLRITLREAHVVDRCKKRAVSPSDDIPLHVPYEDVTGIAYSTRADTSGSDIKTVRLHTEAAVFLRRIVLESGGRISLITLSNDQTLDSSEYNI